MEALPNLDWYLSISTHRQLSPRCPYASVYRCPRFYQSLSLLGEAGSTRINPKENEKLKETWEKTDVWPITTEQATSISGPGDEIKHFTHFCPEVLFDRFGLFTNELHKYADEIDIGGAHKQLLGEGALPDNWRWNWSYIEPMHYTECPLYSLLRAGKGRNSPKPTFPDMGLPDSIAIHTISVTIGDDLTAKDVEELIKDMFEHPEIKTFEVYFRGENPHLKKAINDFKISSDTVGMHYYKDPEHDLNFIKVHKNNPQSDWEKHLVATSPMYFKRVISLTDKQREKMEMKQSQTIWDKINRNPVYIIIALVGSIASIFGLLLFFFLGTTIDQRTNLAPSSGFAVHQAEREIVKQQQTIATKESPPYKLGHDTKRKESQPTNKSIGYSPTGQQGIPTSDEPSKVAKSSTKSSPNNIRVPISSNMNKKEHPLLLYCTCKAEQTFCFNNEAQCQLISPDYGCIQKYSSVTAFNVFDKNKWHNYDTGWVYGKKCIIEERRTQ